MITTPILVLVVLLVAGAVFLLLDAEARRRQAPVEMLGTVGMVLLAIAVVVALILALGLTGFSEPPARLLLILAAFLFFFAAIGVPPRWNWSWIGWGLLFATLAVLIGGAR